MANVSYNLALSLITGGDSYLGHVRVNFTLNKIPNNLFIDYKGRKVMNLIVNGNLVPQDLDVFKGHRILIPE